MAGLCRGTRLLPNRLSLYQSNRSVRNFSLLTGSQARDGQTRLTQRHTALPSGSRGLASMMENAQPATSNPEWQIKDSPDGNPDLNLEFVRIGDSKGGYHPVALRDACPCPKCIDPSTTQKRFQTTDIPPNITAESVEVQGNGDVTIKWKNDIPAWGSDHMSTFPALLMKSTISRTFRLKEIFSTDKHRLWNNQRISEELELVNFEDYMKDDKSLFRAVTQLRRLGLLLVRNVPESEEAVAQIAERIGTIRNTFYGKTWNVRSVPEAKNVAYTHQSLGLHMDLQYMQNPPGFQFLHCLKNTCEGGASLFSDAINAASRMKDYDIMELSRTKMAYQYRNAGEHYYMERPLIELGDRKLPTSSGLQTVIEAINYSPPFQAPIPISKPHQGFLAPFFLQALRRFVNLVESPEAVHRLRLKEGECVIFNNRRILHGREAFEPGNGERLLKGTYLDTDVLSSKWRALNKQFDGVQPGFDDGQHVYPGNWKKGAKRRETYSEMRRAQDEKSWQRIMDTKSTARSD